MTDWKMEDVFTALLDAGEVALHYYDHPDAQLKSDNSIVTEADRAIEHDLEKLFNHPENGSYLIGEETVDTKSNEFIEEAFRNVAWIVDPIDGTACYAHHIPIWGISIARMERGTITDGGVYLPVTGEMFITDGPSVLYGVKQDRSLTTGDLRPLEIEKKTPDVSGAVALSQTVVKRGSFALDNTAHGLACAVVPLTYLLLGRYIAYLGTIKLWDIAGCRALLDRAGFRCVFENGKTLTNDVTEDFYHLEPDHPKRWYLKGRMICGATQEAVDYLKQGLDRG